MKHDLLETIERWKIKAKYLINNNIKSFLVDLNNTYYFSYILSATEDTITVQCFKGQNKGERKTLLWADVVKLEEYKERGG